MEQMTHVRNKTSLDLPHVRNTHKWTRYTVLRAALAGASLLSMLLASGAASKWI